MRYKQEAEEQGHSWFWPVIIVIALILIYYLYEKHAGVCIPKLRKMQPKQRCGLKR